MPYPDGNPTLTEQLEEDARRRFYTDDIIKEAKELETELGEARAQVAALREALEQAERALDGSYRSAGQSTAGWLAVRRLTAIAIEKARALLNDTAEVAAGYQKVPEGWKAAPVEPTEDMVGTGLYTLEHMGVPVSLEGARYCFKNMLAHAPQAGELVVFPHGDEVISGACSEGGDER